MELRGEYYQFNINPKFSINKKDYYLCVIGDYITEIFIDEKLARDIDNFFIEAKSFGEKNLRKYF